MFSHVFVCPHWGWGRVGEGGLSLCPGVSFQGGLCPGRSLSGGLCFLRCLSVHGGLGLCLGVSVWGSLSRESLSREVSVQGVSVQGGLYLGVSVQGGFLSRGSLSGRPPYGNERAVCILLECILA